jgi:hypothetical protein
MNQEIRNKLRNVVTQCRKLLEDSVSQELEGKYGIFAKKDKKDQVTADPNAKMTHLSEEEQAARKDILDHFGHIQARGFKPYDSLDQLIREVAFTHLNRLCAYKMMEAREVYVGGQKFREAVSRGVNSNGVKFYLADHEEEERLFNTGQQDVAYRRYLDWLGGQLSGEIGVLFNPNDPANRLYPRQKTLDEVLELLNDGGINAAETELREQWPLIWSQDETIGWVYQYFTPKELRDKARKESQAPRNSYELAFRNQFFTPRYVVEFLTDNTLGRIWYEMRKGETKLKDQCRYMVRRPTEIFLKEGEQPPKDATEGKDDLSQEELLKLPVHTPDRPKKDPRELKILDPACGSGHFLLYCFDLLLTIYEEAYADPDLGPALKKDYPTLDALKRDVPRLILAHNLHGIDIDLRASQIAALALWLRCQRAYQETGLKKDRPQITRSNFVCAEPMPGEDQMLKEFVGQLEPKVLGQVVEVVFDKMKLAGEAGSLLKIEEEIRDAVAHAKKQWLAGPVSIQRSLFDDDTPVPQQQRFDVSGITDTQFFEQAEGKVVDALRSYAEKAQNGHRLQRRLFTEDAVRGFAFVDLSHNRFDVVLMNPPFGDAVPSTVRYISSAFPASKNDLYASFVRRGLELLVEQGLVGAITSRVGFFAANLKAWRESNLLGEFGSLTTVADLGHGVLDSALVEAAAYVISRELSPSPMKNAYFATVLDASDKGQRLCDILNGATGTGASQFSPTLATIRSIPGSPLAYWLPYALELAISEMPSLSSIGGKAAVGLQTDDDFRFIRLLWETPCGESGINKKWIPLSKGGEYSPYFDDLHLALNWKNGGEEIKAFVELHYTQWSRSVRNVDLYFRSGLTYPERTTSDFSPRPLPANSIFSIKGPGIFFDSDDLRLAFLGFAYSRVCKLLLEVFVGLGDAVESGSAARDYRAGIFNALPFPPQLASSVLSRTVRLCVASMQSLYRFDETSTYFCRPALVRPTNVSLKHSYQLFRSECEDTWLAVLENSWRIDEMCAEKCGLNGPAKGLLSKDVTSHPCEYERKDIDDDEFHAAFDQNVDALVDDVTSIASSRHLTKKSHWANRHLELLCHKFAAHPESIVALRRRTSATNVGERDGLVSDVFSYCCGVALGRWDIRKSLGEADQVLRDAFASVPVCSSGMLVGADGMPSTVAPDDYPVRIDQNGILVDDPEHHDDIVRRVRDVIEVIWEDRADAIEKEGSEVLGVKELREYFRKPSKGGFWDNHVSRYSKSRRKAPIYWLLQSSKKNYAIWLFYHRLDKDLLFKALVNYVEPKNRLETSRLDALRNQKAVAGESGKEAKRLAKEVERQEDFLSELQDFEDKLRRAANLNLTPDLNDGVVLNIAPLHELVPLKDAKSYWEELLKGEYDWSSIGKQLRQKGLVK